MSASQVRDVRRLRIELPEKGVQATVRLLDDAAPEVCDLIWNALRDPLETHTAHACFDGEEVYCFLPPFGIRPPLQNQTMRPRPGEVMFFFAGENEFACTRDDRLSGGSSEVHELAFMYGETDLRHYYEEGFRGSLVGVIEEGLDAFAAECKGTLTTGRTALRVSRELSS
jgi:hypothetical protein